MEPIVYLFTRLITVKVGTTVSLNITQASLKISLRLALITFQSTHLRLALNDGNGNVFCILH